MFIGVVGVSVDVDDDWRAGCVGLAGPLIAFSVGNATLWSMACEFALEDRSGVVAEICPLDPRAGSCSQGVKNQS